MQVQAIETAGTRAEMRELCSMLHENHVQEVNVAYVRLATDAGMHPLTHIAIRVSSVTGETLDPYIAGLLGVEVAYFAR